MAETKKKNSSKAPAKSSSRKPGPEARKAESKEKKEADAKNQTYAVILFAVAILLFLLALVQGENGWYEMHRAFRGFFGAPLLLIPVSLVYIAVKLDKKTTRQEIMHRSMLSVVMTVFLSALIETLFGGGRLLDLQFDEAMQVLFEEGSHLRGGGMVGYIIFPLQYALGDIGSKIVIALLLFVSIMLVTKKTLSEFFDMLAAPFRYVAAWLQEDRSESRTLQQFEEEEIEENRRNESEALLIAEESSTPRQNAPEFLIDIPMEETPQEQIFNDYKDMSDEGMLSESMPDPEQDAALEELIRKATEKPKKRSKEDEKLEAMLAIADEVAMQAETHPTERPYQMPKLDFLNKGVSHAKDMGAEQELHEKANLLKEVLKSFNVDARITNIARGPSVTRYEVQPAAGVKVSRITSLANDIALNFAVEGVRMEAPIPGKPAVGIEVPNTHRDTVALRDLLESRQFSDSRSKLTFGIGKDIAGNVILGDIAKMPHMIIAGATGSGKSVCTNSIIMSILYHASPEEVRLILIDPKIVEFRVYDGIPHLLIPVVTDPKKAAGALNWAVQEMKRRYDVFAEKGVRNLSEFNAMCKDAGMNRLPQIVICIDELAELMMTASKEVEDSVCRLAQLARAAGMHLIIATQRPTTNIITGLIKANIPSRIALSVKSQIDSRVILDMSGAETLLGNGDMLYLPNGQPKPVRVQGCYVSTGEIERVVNFIKSQSASEYDENIMQAVDQLTAASPDEKTEASGEEPVIDEDAGLLDQAIEVVVTAGQASTSNLQRRLRLGYGRAARIMDELEKMGIIGPYEGAKPRRVLMTKEQLSERKLRNMK